MLGVVNRWAGRAYRCVVAAVNLPDLLLKTGAMTGPYRRAKPMTVSLFSRLLRQLRAHQFEVKP